MLSFVADLPRRIAEVPTDREVWVVCTNGHRAAIAASMLAREGRRPRLVARGGILGVLHRLEQAGEPTPGTVHLA